MLNTNAFKHVTAVKFVGDLTVKMSDADAGTPTQLEGKCQLSGLSLSEFLGPQRKAFKSVVATMSGAANRQVLIKNVFAASRRRLRLLRGNHRQLLDSGIVVDFAITVDPVSVTEPESNQQSIPVVAIAVIVVASVLVPIVVVVVVGVTVAVCRKKLHRGKIKRSYSDVQVLDSVVGSSKGMKTNREEEPDIDVVHYEVMRL